LVAFDAADVQAANTAAVTEELPMSMRSDMIKHLSFMHRDGTEQMVSNLSNRSLDNLCAMLHLPFDGGDRAIKESAIISRAAMLQGDRRKRNRGQQRRFKHAYA
jgi:hypothetical protein